MGHAGFHAIMTVLVMVFLSMALWLPPERGGAPPAIVWWSIVTFVLLFQLLLILPSAIATYGLFKHKRWARTASIIAGVVSALNVPFGTAACIYSLWFFLGDSWKELYAPGTGKYADARDLKVEPENLRLIHEREARWAGMHTDTKGEVTFKPVEPPDWR